MNNIAISPYIGLHALQIQNVKRNTAKKVSINELNNEVITISNTNSENVTNENIEQNLNSSTQIDDLPSVSNHDKQENVNNNSINE